MRECWSQTKKEKNESEKKKRLRINCNKTECMIISRRRVPRAKMKQAQKLKTVLFLTLDEKGRY